MRTLWLAFALLLASMSACEPKTVYEEGVKIGCAAYSDRKRGDVEGELARLTSLHEATVRANQAEKALAASEGRGAGESLRSGEAREAEQSRVLKVLRGVLNHCDLD